MPSSLTSGVVVAAETGAWEALTAPFRNGPAGGGIDFRLCGGLLSTLAVVWWMSAIYLRRRGSAVRKVDSPPRLFRELCKAHRLSWAETALIEQLAEARELDDPSRLFVRDDEWSLDDLQGAPDDKAAAIAKLREKLFSNSGLGARDSELSEDAERADAAEAV